PPEGGEEEPAREGPGEEERAGHAEEVPGDEQDEDQDTAVVHPRQDGGEVPRSQLRAEPSVEDHRRGHEEERDLEGDASSAPPQEASKDRSLEQVPFGRRGHRARTAGTLNSRRSIVPSASLASIVNTQSPAIVRSITAS